MQYTRDTVRPTLNLFSTRRFVHLLQHCTLPPSSAVAAAATSSQPPVRLTVEDTAVAAEEPLPHGCRKEMRGGCRDGITSSWLDLATMGWIQPGRRVFFSYTLFLFFSFPYLFVFIFIGGYVCTLLVVSILYRYIFVSPYPYYHTGIAYRCNIGTNQLANVASRLCYSSI